MSGRDLVGAVTEDGCTGNRALWWGASIRELIALANEGRTPLLADPGDTGAPAVPALSVIDLDGVHIGQRVVVIFAEADPQRPVVLGVLTGQAQWPQAKSPAQAEVSVDGEQLLVTAKRELVLRCGKASITLTQAGKILINGAYVLSRSTGVNRIKGGSVQLN
jgi:hypothetical protein